MPFEPGQQVGRYRVIRLLAQGGMAEVYRAEQELAAGIFRPAALKVIRPEYSESADFREMFLDEARTACTLSHPNIVHIYEVGEADGLLYMAMELVPGQTLAVVSRALRESQQRLSDEALLAVGIYTCSALEAVHALTLPGEGHLNLVHRDVSPHNLLLSSSGSLKLIDFGIAKAVTNRNLTSPGVTKGKAGYFSPEQAMGRALDGRSDLFSLGVTLYKLASGATPFDEHKAHLARNSALVNGRWRPLSEVCPGLPAGLYSVVNRSLQVRPDDRYVGAREMREALEQVALDSKVHVGQGSLGSYVSDDGITSARAPVARPPAAQGPVPAPPGPVALVISAPAKTLEQGLAVEHHRESESSRRKTEPMLPHAVAPRLSRQPWAWRAGAALALLLVAGGAWGWLQLRAKPPPAPAVLRAAPTPRQLLPFPPEELEPGPQGPLPEVEPSLRAPAPEVRREPPHRVRAPSKPVGVEARPPVEIPRGEGRLRVGSVPEGVVKIGRESWGPTPVDRKVSSGQYQVNLTSPDGKKGQCPATVLPDKITILIYDFESGSCR